MGTDLLDQQFAVQLSGLPGGLSEAIERQLARQMKGVDAEAIPLPRTGEASTVGRASAGPRSGPSTSRPVASASARMQLVSSTVTEASACAIGRPVAGSISCE